MRLFILGLIICNGLNTGTGVTILWCVVAVLGMINSAK